MILFSCEHFLGLMLCIQTLSQRQILFVSQCVCQCVCHFEDEMTRDRSPRVQVVWVLVVSSCFVGHCFQRVVVAVFSLCWENFEELSVVISSICSR